MSKRKVGLYLGVSCAAAVVVENRKVISLSKFDLSSVEEENPDALNDEVRWEALVNRTLREAGAEEDKDIYVSVTDRDFIFRSFEMPLMKRREITSSLVYEIEKYIPFKTEELRWDYRFASFPKEKKIDISFVGIREDSLRNIQDVLKRLNLNPVYIEPSALSVVRAVKSLPRFSQCKNFALLDYTSSEAYLTFFYSSLPIFNRYLVIPKEGGSFNWEKLIEAVRLSFLYFKREYKFYEPDKMIILGASQNDNLIAALKDDLQTEMETVALDSFISRENRELEHIKAWGVVERESYPASFSPALLTTDIHLSGKAEKIAPLKTGLIVSLGIAGIIAGIGFNFFVNNKLGIEKQAITQADREISLPAGINSWGKIESEIDNIKGRVRSLEKLSVPLNKISPFLSRLPYFLPQGLWLDSLEMAAYDSRYKIILRGNIFLSDAYQERLEIDEFILSLKDKEEVKSIFSNIQMTSSERRKTGEFMVTFFTIKLE